MVGYLEDAPILGDLEFPAQRVVHFRVEFFIYSLIFTVNIGENLKEKLKGKWENTD